MSINVPDLQAKVRVDTTELSGLASKIAAATSGLGRTLAGPGQDAGEQLGEGITRGADGKLRDARGRFVAAGRSAGDGFSTGAKGALAGFAGGVLGGVLADVTARVGAFATGSVDAFAQLEDSTAAAGVLFGGAADSVEDFADRASTAYGISEQAAVTAAGTFGTFGKAAGLQGEPLAKFSTDLTGLAGDLASFKGTSTEQAVEAVGAALRGEAEPIRAYGILLDDATLRQEALTLGLIKSVSDGLSPQQKVLAAQSAIAKQASDATGDFARTSDSTANTQKRLAAETANSQAELGQRLAPAITAVREALLVLIVGLTASFDFFTRNADVLGPLAILLGVITVALGAQAIATGVATAAAGAYAAVQTALNFVLTANPIGLVVIAIAALVAGIVIAYRRSETFRAIVQAAFAGIQVAITASMEAGRAVIAAVMAFINGDVTGKMGQVRAVVGAVMRFVAQIIGDRITAAKDIIQGVTSIIVGLFTGDFGKARDGAVQAMRGLLTFVGTIPGAILRALSGLGTLLLGVGSDIVAGMAQGVRNAAGSVGRAAADAARGALSAAKDAILSRSPSRLAATMVGEPIPQGMAAGIDAETGVVEDAARRMALAGIPDVSGPIGTVTGAISGVGSQAAASGFGGVVDLGAATIAQLVAAMQAQGLTVLVSMDGEQIASRVDSRIGADAAAETRAGGMY